jgi:CBS domain containing-hemolysin-like protein
MTVFTWAVILILIAVNALYVLAEFAAVSIRKSRVHELADEGNALARRLLPVISDTSKLDRYIAVCQIGITISSLILGAFGQARLAVELAPVFERFGSVGAAAAQSTAAVVVLVGLTIMQVVLGELIPKSLALQFPVQCALYTVLPMRWSSILFSWFIVILNGSGNVILRLMGVPQGRHRHIHSPEEIDLLLVESRDGGLLEPDEQQRLHSALQLGIRPAHQLMVPRRQIEAIEISTPFTQVLRHIAHGAYTRLPVYEGSIDNVVGLLHTKDLVAHYIQYGEVGSIEQVTRPVLRVPKTISGSRLIAQLRETHNHQAVLMDEFGGVEGLVTLEDILASVLGETDRTERIKGEILPDGRVRLPGLMRLAEVDAWTGVAWQGTADTVGGHVVDELGHIPVPGEQLNIEGVLVTVERVENQAVSSLVVTRPSGGEEVELG